MNSDKTSIPMKLCNICSQLNWTVLSHGTPIEHQPSFTALLTASKECEMCLMFLDGVRANSWCSDEQFKAVESQGRSPCLIEGNESSIKYWIPKRLEGRMDWMSGAGEMEFFDLSNCYGKHGF